MEKIYACGYRFTALVLKLILILMPKAAPEAKAIVNPAEASKKAKSLKNLSATFNGKHIVMVKRKMVSATSHTHIQDKDTGLHVISPEEEYRYWESQYESADKAVVNLSFDISYGPAYRHGIDAFIKNGGKPYDLIDEEGLASAWKNMDEKSSLSWDDAKVPVRKAYDRLYEASK